MFLFLLILDVLNFCFQTIHLVTLIISILHVIWTKVIVSVVRSQIQLCEDLGIVFFYYYYYVLLFGTQKKKSLL